MSYLENYKKNKGPKSEQAAFDYLINDLLRDNLHGNDKMREITGVNMEEKASTNFIPSMFYIFAYSGKNKDKMGDSVFYDMVPMIFCTECDSKSVTGINFNYVPNNIRAVFMDIITGSYEDYYEHDAYDSDFKVNEKLGGKLINPSNLSEALKLLKSKLGVDLNLCIRKYDRKNILSSRMIEIDMWKYIPFLSFKDSVRGINLAKVQTNLIQLNK